MAPHRHHLLQWALALLLVGCAQGESADGPSSEDIAATAPDTPAVGVDTEPATEPSEDGPQDEDLSDYYFDPESLHHVHVEIDPEDWEVLRQQGRTLLDILGEDCMSPDPVSPFTWFSADVTIDGVLVPETGIRKKGFLGSLNPLKPSLKLKFDKYVDGQRLGGMERYTVNNANQDPSHLNTCMTYQVFHKAGLPAPRCNFSRVTVNDWELGVFVHVEAVKKRFLRRWFDDDEGKLYEGTLSDFREDWSQSLIKKTNTDDEDDRAEIQGLTEALLVPDSELIPSLEAWIDLPTFYRFWALEVLVGHWDGYNGNRNNFFVYFDPSTGKFTFLPWGPDATFGPLEGLSDTENLPRAVMARSALAYRLYHHSEGRQGYLDAMQWLLDEVWDEEELHGEIDRMAALVEPAMESWESPKAKEDTPRLHAFVEARRAEVQAEIDMGGATWPEPLGDPPCMKEVGDVQATFSTTWGSIVNPDLFQAGTGTLDISHTDWGDFDLDPVGSHAGMSDEPSAPDQAKLVVLGLLPDGAMMGVRLHMPPDLLVSGTSVPLDFFSAEAAVFYVAPGAGPSLAGFLLGGVLELEEASSVEGAPLVGTMESVFMGFAE
ncbi:MAG: CotH kinase family protein [Myxococcota bacterium]|nr:CotH kinase family protein [Myxococcota bacterium]